MQPRGEEAKDYWQHEDEGLTAQDVADDDQHVDDHEDALLTWQASEAIHHEKHALWFVGLIVVAVALLALSVLVMQSWTFAVLIVIMAIAVIVISSRPPRVMNYTLSAQSIKVNEKMFSLHDFRAFGVVQEGPLYSIVLIPHKRFMPSVNVYFPTESGEQIVDIFGSRLPMEQVEPDIIDKLSHKLRF